MRDRRRLFHETLERRQLLAIDCLPVAPSDSIPAAEASATLPDFESSVAAEGEFGSRASWGRGGIVKRLDGPFDNDLVQEDSGKLYVVDPDVRSRKQGTADDILFVFERDDSGLRVIAEVQVGFRVDRMVIREDQAILFGIDYHPVAIPLDGLGDGGSDDDLRSSHLKVLTVNLGEQIETVRQDFDGTVIQLLVDGDRIVTVTSDPRQSFVVPGETFDTLTVYSITPDGLSKHASTTVPSFSTIVAHGGSLLTARTVHQEIVYIRDDANASSDRNGNDDAVYDSVRAPDDDSLPSYRSLVLVTQHRVSEDSIDPISEIEIGEGYLHNLFLTNEGRSAVVSHSDVASDTATSLSLLDLSGDAMSLFETIPVPAALIDVGDDNAILTDYVGTVFVVDLNMSIDVSNDARVRRLELPDNVSISGQALRLGGDRLVLMAHRRSLPDDRLLLDDVPHRSRSESLLLTYSLTDPQAPSESPLGDARFAGHRVLHSIDGNRIGFLVTGVPDEGSGQSFLYGELDESSQFVREGTIPVGNWIEFDVSADRLLARESDRLIEYRWDDPDNPIETPLGEPDPGIVAVDDHLSHRHDGKDLKLNPLENDDAYRVGKPYVEIVELIGAHEQVEIVHGSWIRVPASLLAEVDSLQFEYVISNGDSESTAEITIDVVHVSDDLVDQLVEQVRRQTADDLNVSVDEVKVVSVERVFNEPLPVRPDDAETPINLSPGILVTFHTPESYGLYAANLDGEIAEVFTAKRNILAELGLRIVNEAGEVLTEVEQGSEFWIELTGRDLRPFGHGIFAVFFDLDVPKDLVQLTGDIELDDGFQRIWNGEVLDDLIRNFGAIRNRWEPLDNDITPIARIRATAIAAGDVNLKPEVSYDPGAELLLHGRDTSVPATSVRLRELLFRVTEPVELLDANGNGRVSAADALVIINFLRRFGTVHVDEIAGQLAPLRVAAEGEATQTNAMRRYDTNGNGTVTALDALLVINRLNSMSLRGGVASEIVVAMDDDDDDMLDIYSS